MGHMNGVQYFKFSQICALESAVEILTLFWVSLQGCAECSGDCPLKAEEGSLAITGAANEATRPKEKQLSLLSCIFPPVWRFMLHPTWVGPQRHVALPELCGSWGWFLINRQFPASQNSLHVTKPTIIISGIWSYLNIFKISICAKTYILKSLYVLGEMVPSGIEFPEVSLLKHFVVRLF